MIIGFLVGLFVGLFDCMFLCVCCLVSAGFIQCAMVWANINILCALDHVLYVCIQLR